MAPSGETQPCLDPQALLLAWDLSAAICVRETTGRVEEAMEEHTRSYTDRGTGGQRTSRPGRWHQIRPFYSVRVELWF